MKKMFRTMSLLLLLLLMLATNAYAIEDEYVLTKEYSYKNVQKREIKSGFVEIFVGSGDFVSYQNDDYITITPTPDEIKTDDFGNVYAYFDLKGLRAGGKFNITLKRKFTTSTYFEMIPSRTNSEVTLENEKYLKPQKNIECDDEELIAKAKEITIDMISDYKKAEAIFEYVNVNMKYDTAEKYANKGALSAFNNLRGVCEEFSTLYVAMCRAVGIPSRVVKGYKIDTEETEVSGEKISSQKLTNHAWAEIYLEDYGWVPVEPTVIKINSSTSKREAYLDSFCEIQSPEYIALGVYYEEKPDRLIKGVEEISLIENIEKYDSSITEEENEFEDLNGYEWAEEAIQKLYGLGIVNGYSEKEFGPQNNISRIEFIAMLSRMLKYKETPYESNNLVYYYLDYDKTHWSKDEYDYLMRCYEYINPFEKTSAGYYTISEIFDGSLDMNKPITRAEVVALMDAFLPENNLLPSLNDIWGHRFEKSIVKSYNAGLIIGYPDLSFKPDNNISRAEIAVILERYLGNRLYNII